MKINMRDLTKIPNILTIIRILLIPVFVVSFFRENSKGDEGSFVLAVVILILSAITDVADGFIARRFNMGSDLGKIIDPFADKLTQAAVVVCLIFRYAEILPLLAALFGLYVVKECTMLAVGVHFLGRGKDLGGSKWYGKLATVVFYIVVVILVAVPSVNAPIAAGMVAAVIITSLLAFGLYMREYYGMAKALRTESKADDRS